MLEVFILGLVLRFWSLFFIAIYPFRSLIFFMDLFIAIMHLTEVSFY